VETIIYLAYGQNCLLECRSTELEEREGSETSGKGMKEKDSKRAGVYGHRVESERVMCGRR